jgi:hypothetical protein
MGRMLQSVLDQSQQGLVIDNVSIQRKGKVFTLPHLFPKASQPGTLSVIIANP